MYMHWVYYYIAKVKGLCWRDENRKLIIRKAQQRMYFLRQLNKVGVSREMLTQFYRAVIESVLTFSITVWYGSTTRAEKLQSSQEHIQNHRPSAPVFRIYLSCSNSSEDRKAPRLGQAFLFHQDSNHPFLELLLPHCNTRCLLLNLCLFAFCFQAVS